MPLRVIIELAAAAPAVYLAVSRGPGWIKLVFPQGASMQQLADIARSALSVEERDAVRAHYGRPLIAEEPDPVKTWGPVGDVATPENTPPR